MAMPAETIAPRETSLAPLLRDVHTLKGVGPALLAALHRLGIHRVLDLLLHAPVEVMDRTYSPGIGQAEHGRHVTLTVEVVQHFPSPPRTKKPYRVLCANATGFVHLVYFAANRPYLETLLPIGATMVISGRFERFGDTPQMVHPDLVLPPEKFTAQHYYTPLYPLTDGLSHRTLGKLVDAALPDLPPLHEWADSALVEREHWPTFTESITRLHHPQAAQDVAPESPFRQRLAYDEILAQQLSLALIRQKIARQHAPALGSSGTLRQQVQAALPFTLTDGQHHAMQDILGDLHSGERMSRLLQGDVGSGKTAIALLAACEVLENPASQVALMAPTGLLCQQHLEWIQPFLAAHGISVVLLTGRDKGKAREEKLAAIADGSARLVIGTHALFQEGVHFHTLRLAIIDEQHRFGVEQRVRLLEKSPHTHLLMMTATPIPRSLTLTLYGDMDCTLLTQKPAGRKPIDTRIIPLDRLDEVIASLERAMGQGHKVYWICPLVEDSEKSDLAAAEARFAEFRMIFGPRATLAHGKMKPADREAALQGFAGDAAQLLVATTVVEVGINVPSANIIVIEHAERFGLAQLHQLRGRVGRSDAQSTCLLLYASGLSANGVARLKIMRETNDGFRIAEEDLRLRGGGDILGTRQSGLPEFRFAELAKHAPLFTLAQQDARLLLQRDATLSTSRGEAAQQLLTLFPKMGEMVRG